MAIGSFRNAGSGHSRESIGTFVMLGSRKFSQRGSKFDNFFFVFLVDEGIEDPNITINGPSTAASKTPLKWRFAGGLMMTNSECWLGSFVIFQVFQASFAKKPYIFVIFQGGGGGPEPLPPSLDSPILVSNCFSIEVRTGFCEIR